MQEFKRNGHKVYIACSNEKRNVQQTSVGVEDGKNVLRIRIGNLTGNVNIIEKGLSTILLESRFIKAIKRHYCNVKFDLVIYSTPPITFARVVEYFKKRDKAKTYLLLKDIFPQNAVDIELMKNDSLVYKYFKYKEKELYRVSDYIGCMSQANVEFVLKNNPDIQAEKVEVCPNSITPLTLVRDEYKINEVKKKYNIPLIKTVFIYGGNLGKPQGIDFLIECLKANKANEQIYFVIAGSGTEFNKIKAFMDAEKITNAHLFVQLPKNDYEMLTNSCDVGLIFLDRRFTIPNFPSRMLSYMQASMPVLATTDVNTDVGRVIENGNFGLWCESNNVEEFVHRLQQLCDVEIRKQMGANARKYLEENYTAKHSFEIIMKHFG